MAPALGSLILFSSRYAETLEFYRALGLELEDEKHDDGPVHAACDIGGIHIAVFDAAESGASDALPYRSPGSSYVGFAVADVRHATEVLRRGGATVRQEPEEFPWGLRALLEDPDGRVVELFAAE